MRNQNKMYITHVKQIHNNPFATVTNDQIEVIAYSQFVIAKTILANSNVIVLAEGYVDNFTPEAYRANTSLDEERKQIRKVFSHDIPDKFSELNDIQKIHLVVRGAVRILFHLGQISHIYKTEFNLTSHNMHLFQYEDIFYKKTSDKTLPSITLEDINKTREERAIFFSRIASVDTGNNNVLLVYGAEHQFKKRILLENDPDVIYNGSIDTQPSAKQPCFINATQESGYYEFKPDIKNAPTTSIVDKKQLAVGIFSYKSVVETLRQYGLYNNKQIKRGDFCQELCGSNGYQL